MSVSSDDLSNRVERLERENRRLRRIGLLALVVIGVLFVTAQSQGPEPVLRAETVVATKAFLLTDAGGHPRASIGLLQGQPSLTLYGGDSPTPRVQLGAWTDGSTLMLFDSAGKERAMVVVAGEMGSLNLIGPESQLRASVGVVDDAGMAFLFGKDGTPTWAAP
jgi:hypothetical protein